MKVTKPMIERADAFCARNGVWMSYEQMEGLLKAALQDTGATSFVKDGSIIEGQTSIGVDEDGSTTVVVPPLGPPTREELFTDG